MMTPKSVSKTFLFSFLLSTEVYATSLKEFYQRALQRSEVISSSKLDVQISESEKNALSPRLKPKVSLGADTAYHINKYDKVDWNDNKTLGVRTEFRQPLYDGGGTQAALELADANILALQWDVKSSEQALYLRVATLFYQAILQSQDITNLEETIRVLEKRVKDLSDRERIGRSREAEVFSAKTQIELTRGMIAQSLTAKNAAEEELAWLADLPLPLDLDDTLTLEQLKERAKSTGRSEGNEKSYKLPSIAAAEARIQAADKAVKLSRTEQNPQLDFIAQHQWTYLDASDQGFHDFSVGLGLSWLIYDSGQMSANVSTAQLSKTRSLIQKDRLERESVLNISLSERQLQDNLRQIQSYQAALAAVEKTLNVQRKEYESGLITNLDLLTTLNQRLEIRRNLDLNLNRAKLVYIQNEVHTGVWQAS